MAERHLVLEEVIVQVTLKAPTEGYVGGDPLHGKSHFQGRAWLQRLRLQRCEVHLDDLSCTPHPLCQPQCEVHKI